MVHSLMSLVVKGCELIVVSAAFSLHVVLRILNGLQLSVMLMVMLLLLLQLSLSPVPLLSHSPLFSFSPSICILRSLSAVTFRRRNYSIDERLLEEIALHLHAPILCVVEIILYRVV